MHPPQGRWPEHLDFLPLHRRHAVLALGGSGLDTLSSSTVVEGCLELGALVASEARLMCGACVV